MDEVLQNLMQFFVNFLETFVKAFNYLHDGLAYVAESVVYFPSFIGSVILVVVSVLLIRFILLK